MCEYLDQAHDAEFFRRMPDLHARGGHARPADASEARRGKTFAQSCDQVGTEQIAGGFASDEDEKRTRARAHLTSERWPRSMKSSIWRTSGASAATRDSSARACSSGRLDMYSVL